MANLYETSGQHVQQESPNKLDRIDGGGLAVLGSKANARVSEVEQPVVRDFDSVGVAADVIEYLLAAAKGRFGIDDPWLSVQSVYEIGERLGIGQRRTGAVQVELLSMIEPSESIEELASKHHRQQLDPEQEATADRDPSIFLLVQSSGRHDAVGVRMEAQVSGPSVQNGRDTELSVESALSELQQRTGSALQEQIVDPLGLSRASARSSSGSVKTTWKYLVGTMRSRRWASQRACAKLWHFGQ